MEGLKYHHLVPLLHQFSCGAEPGRAGTHYGHLITGRLRQFRYTYCPVSPLIVCGEALQVAYGHGGELLGHYAHLFALVFLWTDPAAYGGEAVVFFQLPGAPCVVSLCDEFDEGRYVYTYGTACTAEGLLALETAAGLQSGKLRGVTLGYLAEVLYPLMMVLLRHALPGGLLLFQVVPFFTYSGVFHLFTSWNWPANRWFISCSRSVYVLSLFISSS